MNARKALVRACKSLPEEYLNKETWIRLWNTPTVKGNGVVATNPAEVTKFWTETHGWRNME